VTLHRAVRDLVRKVPGTFLTALALASPAHAAPAPRANVILIVADDLGAADVHAQSGRPEVKTPNLDALAAGGVRFASGYVAAPQCAPSRAAILTGRYPQRFGVEENDVGSLPETETTLAERLRDAGYATGQVGKWHVEGALEEGEAAAPGAEGEGACTPERHGFTEWLCGSGCNYFASHDAAGKALPDPPARVPDPRARIGVQTDWAVSFVERHAREPFFLYLAYSAPHFPLEAPEPFFSATPPELAPERRMALAMTGAIDEGVGRLRAKLRALGIEGRTLVAFLSDNGATLKRGAWNGSLNEPYVGEKGMLTDGGVRVPLLAEWPGTLPAGRVYDQPVVSLDLTATALAAAGLRADPKLDGVDLVPFVAGKRPEPPHDAIFWRWRSQSGLRAGRWKLVRLGQGRRYLFDLADPAGETRSRLASEPTVAADLERRLTAWSATLARPGLPTAVHPRDAALFDTHVDRTGAVVQKQGPHANVEVGAPFHCRVR
jgi:arylsulfatase A-like enzyme